MDAIEYLKAVFRERVAHFLGGLAGARIAYLESAQSHELPLVAVPSDDEVALELREAHERANDDMWTSLDYSYMVGNFYHRVDHNG